MNNELQIKEYTLNSLEVAKMVDKGHNDLLKDIRKYISYLDEGDFPLTDFFIVSTYIDSQNRKKPCYEISKMGCEMIANKLTGKKGVLFTATYVKKFNKMERDKVTPKLPKTSVDKSKALEIKEKNARYRTASLYLKIANNKVLPEAYRQVFLSYAGTELSGEQLLPLPKSEQKTYSATEIGKMFGVSSQRIGKLTNANNLKIDEYGLWYHDKSRHSVKEVDTFRYFDTIIPKIEELLNIKAVAIY